MSFYGKSDPMPEHIIQNNLFDAYFTQKNKGKHTKILAAQINLLIIKYHMFQEIISLWQILQNYV